MTTATLRTARYIVAAATLALLLTAAPNVEAQLTAGALSVTGTRWANGVPTKVKCKAADGNTLNSQGDGERIMTLVYALGCDSFFDTDGSNQFVFVGSEHATVDKKGNLNGYAFSGVESAPSGGAGSHLSCSGGGCKTEKGIITYQNGAGSIVFVGQYKAKFK